MNVPVADRIQQIRASRRLDAPDADGLVQFVYEGESFVFALRDYVALAEAIAEAAKRTLEDPLTFKRKSKDDDFDFDEDEF